MRCRRRGHLEQCVRPAGQLLTHRPWQSEKLENWFYPCHSRDLLYSHIFFCFSSSFFVPQSFCIFATADAEWRGVGLTHMNGQPCLIRRAGVGTRVQNELGFRIRNVTRHADSHPLLGTMEIEKSKSGKKISSYPSILSFPIPSESITL